jgi:hypothetical protein
MRNTVYRIAFIAISATLVGCAAGSAPPSRSAPSSSAATPSSAPAGAPSPAPRSTAAALPPDGTWQVQLSAADLVAAGWPADVTPPGTYSWTFADDRATVELDAEDGSQVHCEADMAIVDGQVRLTYDAGECGGEVDDIGWELVEGGLRLSLIETNAPLDQQKAYLETKPWQPVE